MSNDVIHDDAIRFDDPHHTISELLIEIERELRVLNLWDVFPPSSEALASQLPFAVDQLTFPQWVQFIFIPRISAMIEQRKALPAVSGIKPMAEQYFHALRTVNADSLLVHFEKVDFILSGKKS